MCGLKASILFVDVKTSVNIIKLNSFMLKKRLFYTYGFISEREAINRNIYFVIYLFRSGSFNTSVFGYHGEDVTV